MSKKRLLLIIGILSLLLVACTPEKLEKSTIFYNYGVSPEENYFRLNSDGTFIKFLGNQNSFTGTYKISDKKVTFSENTGATLKGFLKGDYLYYFAYDGNDSRIPSDDKFDAQVYDGQRTTMTFKSDGTMERYIGQAFAYDYSLLGTYERKGDLIICTFKAKKGDDYSQVYGVENGVLYECYSSNLSDFSEADQKKITDKNIIINEPDNNKSNSIVIVLVISVIIIAASFILIFCRKKKTEDDEEKTE